MSREKIGEPLSMRTVKETGRDLLYSLCYHLAVCIDYYRMHKGDYGFWTEWGIGHKDGDIGISIIALSRLEKRVEEMESEGYCMMDALAEIHRGKIMRSVRKRHDKRIRGNLRLKVEKQINARRLPRRRADRLQ